jgi:tetratricopeptide (TPR) repeat protein
MSRGASRLPLSGRLWTSALLAVLAAAVSLSGQFQSARDPLWDARDPESGDFQSAFELSGRVELALYRVTPDPQDLQSICKAARETEAIALREQQQQVDDLKGATTLADRLELAWAHRILGQLYSYHGEMRRSGEHFQAALDIVSEHTGRDQRLQFAETILLQSLGVAELRRGEIENCVHHHNAERCIFPIRGGGVHTDRSGAKAAVEYLGKVLARDPSDLEVRWLLNVAYMALGQYPDGVPETVLIPQASFEGPAQARFEDVALSRGVDLRTGAGGTVIDDFDNDGLLDLALSSVDACESLRIYKGQVDGTFADVSEQAGVLDQTGGLNMSHADFDNDGLVDLFVHRGGWEAPMRNSLLRNRGDGTFEDVTAKAGLLGRRAHRTHTAAWADYDNDGYLDLFVGNEESPSELYRNRGNGTFEEVGKQAEVSRVAFTKGATWGDYDNDGWPDLYVSNYVGRNFLYRNRGNGTFEEVAGRLGVDRPVMSFATWFFDYDNDGWLDLFVANFVPSVTEVVRGFLRMPQQAETQRLYRNDGRGGFEDVTAQVGLARVFPSMGANFGDIDNDGFPDIYLGTGAPSYAALVPNMLFRNERGRTFSDVTTPSGTGHLQKGHGVAFADLDGSGHEDILVNVGGFVPGDAYWKTLFRNPGSSNGRVAVRLVGRKSNRLGVGARLSYTVRPAGGDLATFHRVVTSGGSFGASPYRQHLGIGDARRIETLDIWWPTSGTRQVVKTIAAGQAIEVVEGEPGYRVLQPQVKGQ